MDRNWTIKEVITKIKGGDLHLSEVEDYLNEHPNYRMDFENDLVCESIVYYENTYLREFLKGYDPDGKLFFVEKEDCEGAKQQSKESVGSLDKQEGGGNKYSQELLELFHNHTELIEKLVGLSDDDVAKKIREWSKEKDKFGKPLIENPNNFGNKSLYSRELKAAGLISCSERTFRDKI